MSDLRSPFLKMSDRFTLWIGSMSSVVVHTLIFIGVFALRYLGLSLDHILLILTTAVSLEAIYLAIFIQMTVNRHSASLADVEENIEELGEEVEDLGEDITEIGEDITGLSKDVDELSGDIDEIQGEEVTENRAELTAGAAIDNIDASLQKLISEIEALKHAVHREPS